MRKTLWQKVKAFLRKWMSAKIIPHRGRCAMQTANITPRISD